MGTAVSSSSLEPFPDELGRLHALRATRLLDTAASESFDRITRLASQFFEVPIALISLVDKDRQWFKARVGLDVRETAREYAFCDHTIRQKDVMVVEDATKDARFESNPLVTGQPGIRFYAGAPLLLPSGHALGSLCVIDRVPRQFSPGQRQQLKDLAALAMTQIDLHRAAGRMDELTQLPNHAQMAEDLADLARHSPGGQRTLLLIEAMDHGAARDAASAVGIPPVENLLRDLSIQLESLLSESSKLYFVGVGRFAVLTACQGAALEQFIDRLLKVLREPVASGELMIELDARVGVVHVGLVQGEIEDALRKAMTTVHLAKTRGLPRVVYAPEFDVRHRRAYGVLRDIPRAIANDEFHLVFQPKLRVRSGVFEGAEALLRWNHPELGNIPPAEFIPLAENTTLIHDITNWVIDAALKHLADLQAEGFSLAVAVNVSARNLERVEFLGELEEACGRYSVRHDLLHIECTEYSGLTAPETLDALNRIRALGMQLSLDDFGIGYSNLSCLASLPFQLLKIDRALVAPIVKDARMRQLLQGIVSLGHAMGFRLLAEGVETEDVFKQIVALGFDHVQGYYLSKPLSPQALRAFLLSPPPVNLDADLQVQTLCTPSIRTPGPA